MNCFILFQDALCLIAVGISVRHHRGAEHKRAARESAPRCQSSLTKNASSTIVAVRVLFFIKENTNLDECPCHLFVVFVLCDRCQQNPSVHLVDLLLLHRHGTRLANLDAVEDSDSSPHLNFSNSSVAMSTQAIPRIPPRPIPTHDQAFSKSVGDGQRSDLPKIPPRPANRRPDRSVSPQRDSFARSPLNEPNFVASFGTSPGSRILNGNALGIDLPRRPPSVTLPSLGQEGSEYAEILLTTEESDPSPPQTRSSVTDLHLHAPKPSLSASGAKQRVSLVTRTDSTQAAALGIGKANSDDKEPHTRSLKAKASNLSQASTGTERPTTASSDNEHGIPEIGQRVPMCPNAGDVQAPSPSPSLSQHGTSPVFINDSSRMRHHGRRTSARGFEGPPGSYGLHGHGIIPKDRFEQAYYGKHPDLLQKEIGQYTGSLGEGRAQWALSSEDLNKIVRETASKGAGLGKYITEGMSDCN